MGHIMDHTYADLNGPITVQTVVGLAPDGAAREARPRPGDSDGTPTRHRLGPPILGSICGWV